MTASPKKAPSKAKKMYASVKKTATSPQAKDFGKNTAAAVGTVVGIGVAIGLAQAIALKTSALLA